MYLMQNVMIVKEELGLFRLGNCCRFQSPSWIVGPNMGKKICLFIGQFERHTCSDKPNSAQVNFDTNVQKLHSSSEVTRTMIFRVQFWKIRVEVHPCWISFIRLNMPLEWSNKKTYFLIPSEGQLLSYWVVLSKYLKVRQA